MQACRALPYFPEQAREVLANVTSLVLVGAREPVVFLAYPNQPLRLAPDGATLHRLVDLDAGVDAALVPGYLRTKNGHGRFHVV